jgi:peroxiredoxin
LIAIETDETLKGLALLEEAAEQQLDEWHHNNDPPRHPRIVSTVLGEAHLAQSSYLLAAKSFERTLATVKNDGFALSGLARARFALGDDEAAARAYGRLRFVWSDADMRLRWLGDAYQLGLESEPIDESIRQQRRYAHEDLASFGPGTWEPYPAPELDALDPDEERVTLEEYRGRNVVLVFFLGEQCAHCVEQLVALDEKSSDFEERDTQILAISGDSPERNRDSLKMGELGMRLLSDTDFANAKRFHSYDDFEEIVLHSTILIDRQGRVSWARSGGDPFMDLDFLLEQIDRANEEAPTVSAVEASLRESVSRTVNVDENGL